MDSILSRESEWQDAPPVTICRTSQVESPLLYALCIFPVMGKLVPEPRLKVKALNVQFKAIFTLIINSKTNFNIFPAQQQSSLWHPKMMLN